MIIITTTTGNFFINDKNYSLIEHDKDGGTVEVRNNDKELFPYRIKDVKTVTCITESSPTEFTFKDTGEVEKEEHIELLYKALESAENDLRRFASEMIELVQTYGSMMPEQVRKQMRDHGEQMKAKVNHGEYRKHLTDE